MASPEPPAPVAAPSVEESPKHPEADARALYRIAEARFADGAAVEAAAILEQALAVMPGDGDPMVRHRLEARLTHVQLTAWQSTGDLAQTLRARQRVFSRMAAFPTTVASLTPEQAEFTRNELFEQLTDALQERFC